jgi:methylase of polypeptide subunit release factors
MTRIRHSDLLACERALSRITSSASFECKELHQLAILKSKSTATNFNSRLYFEELIKRRLDMREPLQYIVGEWDFSVLKNITVVRMILLHIRFHPL